MNRFFRPLGPFLIYTAFIFLLVNCNGNQKTSPNETPVSGELTIYCDDSFRPVLEAEKEVFQALYKDASLNIEYKPENYSFEALFQDSVELIITGRPLSEKESKYFEEIQARVNEFHFATDAVALLLPETFNNSLTQVQHIKSVFNGNFDTWNDINPDWPEKEIILVFDQSNSSNIQFAVTHLDLQAKNVKIFAAGSNEKVIEYVKKHDNAIGVIGASWINDEESNKSKEYRKGLSLLSIKANEETIYAPFQSSISIKDNPLARKIYIIRRNKNTGLSAGFTTFLMSERGQRIVLKSGIMPAIMPGREIIITQ